MEHAVALSLQQGESDCVTHDAMRQALHAEGLDLDVDAETVDRLQEPAAILKSKHVMGGPGPKAMEAELAHLDRFAASQRHMWQERLEKLQACDDRCRQLEM